MSPEDAGTDLARDAEQRARLAEDAAARELERASLSRERGAGSADPARHERAAQRHDRASMRHARSARDAHNDAFLVERGQAGAADPLQRVLALLGTEPDPDLDRLAALAGRLLGSQVALVTLVHPDRQAFLGESGLAEAGHAGTRSTPIELSLCQGVAATDAPLVLEDTIRDPRVGAGHPAVTELHIRAYAGVPLHAEGETVGALCALEFTPRVWTPDEIKTLADLAGTAEALLEARLAWRRAAELAERERRTSEMLQQGLLPDALPLVPHLRLAAAYRPAETIVGGDWYDVVRLPGGAKVAFALGDVVGHGLEAAAAASRLRSAFQAGLLEDPAPAAALARLNDLASVRDALAYSTVVAGMLDTQTGVLEWAGAGHPPPVIVSAGRARFDSPADNPVLAARAARTPFTARTTTLAPGEGLVLYSDGLVEERNGTLERFEVLRGVCEARWGDPDAVVRGALDTLRPVPGPDDVALLVLQRDGPR